MVFWVLIIIVIGLLSYWVIKVSYLTIIEFYECFMIKWNWFLIVPLNLRKLLMYLITH